MAVHHDKLLNYLRKYSDPRAITNDMANPESVINWESVGKDPESIAGAFRMLKDEINAGAFD
jgi:hypothetical protein